MDDSGTIDGMSVLQRVRADLARGEPWLARDRLVGALGSRRGDPTTVLDALAAVHAELGDLPAAGACWSLTDRADTDPTAAAALTAFQDRYPSPVARAHALPLQRPVGHYPAAAQRRIADLQQQLAATGWTWTPAARPSRSARSRTPRNLGEPPPATWRDRLSDITVAALVVGNLTIYTLGLICLLRWIW